MKSTETTRPDRGGTPKKPTVPTTQGKKGGASRRRKTPVPKPCEEVLRSSEEKFRRLFESVQDGILLLNARTGEITDTNPSLEKLVGYTHEELRGKKIWEIGAFKETFSGMEALRKLQTKRAGQTEDLRLETRDGHRCEVEFVSNIYQVGNQKVIQCNVRDTTEQTRIGHVLEASEERFRKVFDEGPIGMALADPQYHFLQANSTFCRLLEYTEPEVKKLTFKDITHPEDLESSIKNVRDLEKGNLSVYRTEKRYITKSKDVIWGALTLSTILGHEGEVQFFLVMIEDITQRKQAEDSLRESEDKFKYVFDFSVVGRSITLPSGEIQVNQSFCEMLGYSAAELQNKNWQDITHPEDIELTRKELDLLLSGEKEAARFNKRYLKKDGSVVWADASTSIRRDWQGKPLYFMTSLVDITERKQVEEALLESELRFRTLIKEAPVAILISRNGIIEYVNQKDAEIFGLQNGEDLIGRPIIEFLAPQSREESLNHTRRRSLGLPIPSEFDYVGLRPDGSQFPIHVAVTNVQLPGGKANISFITDITEHRKAETALQESEQRFRSIFENTTVGIYRTTPAGQILMANPALVSMLGYSSFEALARRNLEADAFEPGYPRSHFRELIEKDGEVRNLESAWKRQDGNIVYLRESAKVFRTPDGTVNYYEGTTEDITDLKQTEDALRTSEERYRGLFEDSPIALWEEDFAAVKLYLEDLRNQGVTDFRTYFESRLEAVSYCIGQIKILDVNRATLKLLGAESKAQIPRNLSALIPEEAHKDFRDELIHIAEGRTDFEWQGINHTLAGERRVVNMRWSVAPGHEDTLDKVLLSMVDITEQRQAEEQIQILSKFPGENPNPVMRITPTGILLYANSSSAPLLAMWSIQMGQAMPSEWRAWIAEVFRSRQIKEVELNCGERVFSCILTPIVDAGYVNVYGLDITKRKQTDQALARRTEELDRLYRASGFLLSSTPFEAQALARTITEVVLQEFGHSNCSVFLIRKGSNELDRLAVAGPYADQVSRTALTVDGKGQVPQAIRNGQIINTPEVRASSAYVPSWELARSELTIPLMIDDQMIGAIDIQSTEPEAFNANDQRLMSIFAERAALALERGRLNEELERRLRQLTTLRTIDAAISSSMDVHLTLGILLEQVIQTLGVQAADVLIFDPVTQSFRFAAGRGFRTPALQHTDLRLGDGYAGQAARNRQIVSIRDLPRNTGGLQRSADFRGEGFVSYLGAPLIAKGQVKGVLEVFQREAFEPNPEQRSLLEMLASQAAIAIDSGQLFENLQSSNSELMMAYDETIEGWSRAMDLRDKETEGHTQRVTELTLRLANSMGFRDAELVHIRRGTLLHDIGKMGVPDDILYKPGKLTAEEWVIMRKHPQLAYDMIAPILYLRPAIDIPYCHHEKWDGTGYPRGLKGEQIPLTARIFALVDVWDALCSDRPYRKAWPEDKVRSYIREQSGTHFDPHLVEVFLKEVSDGG